MRRSQEHIFRKEPVEDTGYNSPDSNGNHTAEKMTTKRFQMVYKRHFCFALASTFKKSTCHWLIAYFELAKVKAALLMC